MQLSVGLNNFLVRTSVKMVWGVKQRQEFYHLLADFIRDGVPVYEAIGEIHERFVEVKDARRHITQSLLDDQRGTGGNVLRLGQAMGKWVPSLEALAIDAGEQGAGISEGLHMASKLSTVESRIRSSLAGELFYPLILLAMLAGFMIAVDRILLPVFEELLPRDQWSSVPTYLGYLASASNTIITVSAAALFGTFTGFMVTKGRWIGRVRDFLDKHIAPWSIYRRMTGAIFMACFASLTKSGMPFSQVISKLSEIATPWELDHLDRMRAKFRRGMMEGDAMAGDLFDDEPRWKIKVYGKRTNFSQTLESLSTQVADLTVARIHRVAVATRIFVYLLMTGMLAWVYASFLDLSFSARAAATFV